VIESWLKAIRDHPEPLPAEQFRVLTMLALRLDWTSGEGFASTRQLAADARASKSTVLRATDWARQAGLLKEVKRGHRLGDGRTRATEWALISQGVSSDTLKTVVKVSAEQSQGVTGVPHQEPVPPSRPVGSSPKSMVASRRARPAVERDEDKIAIVQAATIRRGWPLADLEDEDALNIYARFITDRKTAVPLADLVAYLAEIFESFDSLDGLLSNTPERDDSWL
jgi:hypothetical protein